MACPDKTSVVVDEEVCVDEYVLPRTDTWANRIIHITPAPKLCDFYYFKSTQEFYDREEADQPIIVEGK